MIKNILSYFANHFITAANDGEITIANAIDGSNVFEIQQADSFFVPYGTYKHPRGLQIFDRESADIMRTAANTMLGRTVGMPVYFGHPDEPGRPDSDPAAPARGWIQPEIIVGNDGATFPRKMGAVGQKAIDDAEFRFYSPRWLLEPVKGGYRPIRLLSMGLTNNPRIPVPALANDDTPTTENNEPMKWLHDTITAALPVTLANDKGANLIDWLKAELAKEFADMDQQVKDAIDWLMRSKERAEALEQAKTDAAAAANDHGIEITRITGELTAATNQATQLGADLATATARVTQLETDLSAANDVITTSRGLRIDDALTRFVATGQITAAQSPETRAALVAISNDADLTAQLSSIETAAPALKTKTALGDLSSARKTLTASNDALAREEKRRAAHEEALKTFSNDMEPGARYDAAWLKARADHPELFTNPAATA